MSETPATYGHQAPAPTFLLLDLESIEFSKSTAQAERRKHFDDAALADLVDSVKAKGVVQPIVVRRNGGPGKYELVAGERRVMAARKAKLREIPAMVHVLSDNQAQEVQLIENLQREGLHELVECEGYELLRKSGLTVEQIAIKVGKSSSYVYKRLELSGCVKAVRAAFFDGKIDASRALLLTSIKDPAQQEECLKELLQPDWNGPMSYRRCVEHVRNHYRLRLDEAPFETENASLVPAAGACGRCPKNTSKLPADLFGDVSKEAKARCTDASCYRQKSAAAAAIKLADARATGATVFEGDAATKIIPENSYRHEPTEKSGYVSLDERCDDDAKGRTYRQLIGKHVRADIVVTPKDSVVTEVVRIADVKKVIKDKGIKLVAERRAGSDTYSQQQAAAQKLAKSDTVFRQALHAAVRPKLAKKLGRPELELVATELLGHLDDDGRKEMTRLWLPNHTGARWNAMDTIADKVPGLADDELVLLILDACFAPSLRAHSYNHSKPEELLAFAKRVKVDANQIRKDCAPAKAKKKAKK